MQALLVLSICASVDIGLPAVPQAPARAPQTPAAARAERVTPQQARQLNDAIGREVADHYVRAGRRVPDAVRLRLVRDLEKQTDGLARSGLSAELIQERNRAYLATIDRLAGPSTELSQGSYEQAYQTLFTRLVKLTIASEPQGARVTLDGHEIGMTSISAHPVEPGKSYTFTFHKEGYQSDSKQLYIAPVPENQDLRSALIQGEGAGGPATPGPDRSFPWHLVAIGVAVLLAGAWLVVRMRS